MSDQIENFRKLQKRAADLRTKKITLEERLKAKKEALKDVVKEVQELGYEPKNLSKIIKEKEEDLGKRITKFEQELEEASNKLSEIEG